MNESTSAITSTDRNKVAALLSLLPGLGHLYKHHYLAGVGLLLGGNLLTGFIAVLMALGTFGLSILVVPLVYIATVAAAAYALPDWHGHHHFLHPWTPEETGEEGG
ncbi:MAG: hypothetical protein K9N23_03685 [Akkermansiaceae bacterium]|nr:hypothetical protein [Akkermansiaceae bacterium]MCF7730758.1 hypothetical protein [Akkermansiaceae bacterium]